MPLLVMLLDGHESGDEDRDDRRDQLIITITIESKQSS